jgi:hypothetical protein
MTLNMKLEHARKLMDKLHERQKKQAADLTALCALLCDVAAEFGEANGADGTVVAAVIAPKEDPKP